MNHANGNPPALFIHVMKTGGTTLHFSLLENFAPDEVYPHPDLDFIGEGSKRGILRPLTMPYLRMIPPERRKRIRVYTGHFPYMARDVLGGDFATVTILRDPVDRTVSLLRQFRRRALWAPPHVPEPMGEMSLEEAYEQPAVYQRLVHNHQTKIFSMTLADAPMGYMHPIHVDESRLALAKENLASVDVVGLTERYDEFLDGVTARFGWRLRRSARANEAPDDDISSVSDSFRRRVVEDNAIDVEFYEYAKDLVDARRRSR
jgi:hypothetical protein